MGMLKTKGIDLKLCLNIVVATLIKTQRLFKAFEKNTNFQKILSPHFKPVRIKGITWREHTCYISTKLHIEP